VNDGEIVGLIEPNGSGQWTVLNPLTGIVNGFDRVRPLA